MEIASILVENGAEVNRQDAAGFTPLTLAIQADNLQMVALLVRSNAALTLTGTFLSFFLSLLQYCMALNFQFSRSV